MEFIVEYIETEEELREKSCRHWENLVAQLRALEQMYAYTIKDYTSTKVPSGSNN